MRTAKENLEAFAPSTAQKNINLAILSSVAIPLPPLNEQKRIVAKVDYFMSLCNQLEQDLVNQDSNATDLSTAMASAVLSNS